MKMSRAIAGSAILMLAAFVASPARAQEQGLKNEIEALKKGQQEILQQIQDLKKLIQSQPQARAAGPNVKDVMFDLGNNPVRGAATAKLTLIEFTDYQ
jgi:protein-disulfide isomerase